MRTRYIKPGFFKNEELAAIEPLYRILFVGLWCLADREGRLEDRPKKIKVEVLPYDLVDIEAGLGSLENAGFVTRYSLGTQKLIQIHTFKKHQNPHKKEARSSLPPHPNNRRESEKVPESPVQAREIPERARPIDSNLDFDSNLELKKDTSAANVATLEPPNVATLLKTLSNGKALNGAGKKQPGEYAAPATDIQKFLLVVKQLQGFALDDRTWDTVYFKRYGRAAKDVLKFFDGDWKRAGECAAAIAHEMDSLGRPWTVETIIKLAPAWKNKNGQ